MIWRHFFSPWFDFQWRSFEIRHGIPGRSETWEKSHVIPKVRCGTSQGFTRDIDMVPFDAQLGAFANFDDLRGLFMFGLWIISYWWKFKLIFFAAARVKWWLIHMFLILCLIAERMAASSICHRAGRPETRWYPVFWRGLGHWLLVFLINLPSSVCHWHTKMWGPGSGRKRWRWSQWKYKSFQVDLDACDALFNQRWGERPFAESISHRGGFEGIDEERCFSLPGADI
jgi:hypothetical protein